METINAFDFRARCLALPDQVRETGERIVILKRGRPVAELSPPLFFHPLPLLSPPPLGEG